MFEWEARLDNCYAGRLLPDIIVSPITTEIKAMLSNLDGITEADQNLVIRWSASKNILR